jgi:hypothetical protein
LLYAHPDELDRKYDELKEAYDCAGGRGTFIGYRKTARCFEFKDTVFSSPTGLTDAKARGSSQLAARTRLLVSDWPLLPSISDRWLFFLANKHRKSVFV